MLNFLFERQKKQKKTKVFWNIGIWTILKCPKMKISKKVLKILKKMSMLLKCSYVLKPLEIFIIVKKLKQFSQNVLKC